MPILSVFAILLKSRFFVIYFRGVTRADGKSLPLTREVDFAKQKTEGEKSLPQSRLTPCQPPRQRGPLHIAIALDLCYNSPKKGWFSYEKDTVRLPWHYTNCPRFAL